MVGRARDLVPLLTEHRGEVETENRIARSVHEAMSDAGMFRLMAPKEVDGLELEYPHVLAAIEEIAVGDITASWYGEVGSDLAPRVRAGLSSREPSTPSGGIS